MSSVSLARVNVRRGSIEAVHELSLEVGRGSWVGLIGPNGAGKSSALAAIAGLIPFTGSIAIGGDDLTRLSRGARARRVALVPQLPMTPPLVTVADYVLMGRTPHLAAFRGESADDLAIVADVLDRLDLAGLASRHLTTLSGGERQRAVVARAVAQGASVLLLDEPTSALDVGHQQGVLDLVARMRDECGLTVISAMHDLTLAGLYADRLVLLASGRTIASGLPAEVLTETTIAEHYGATVRIVSAADGSTAVIPTRTARGSEIHRGA
jgi:iron complex transport system ATP-binding protein